MKLRYVEDKQFVFEQKRLDEIEGIGRRGEAEREGKGEEKEEKEVNGKDEKAGEGGLGGVGDLLLGKEGEEGGKRRWMNIGVREDSGGLDRCEICVGNFGTLFMDDSISAG